MRSPMIYLFLLQLTSSCHLASGFWTQAGHSLGRGWYKAAIASGGAQDSSGKVASAWELLKQEFFRDLSEAFEGWSEEELRTLDRADLTTLFLGDKSKIGKGLRLIRLLPPPELKLIYLHECAPEDPEAESLPPIECRIRSTDDLEKILASLGAWGLCTRGYPQVILRELSELRQGGEYWLHFGPKSPLVLLSEEAKESRGFRKNYARAWKQKVNMGLPGVFAPENLTLVQLFFKDTQHPYKREIDGIFLDIDKRVVVVVEAKSGAMKLSNKTDEDLRGLLPGQLMALASQHDFADLQLLATANAIRESTGPIGAYGKMNMTLVLAASYLDSSDREHMNLKRKTFRFVHPDGTGLVLDPVSGLE